MFNTKEELITAIINRMPYSSNIKWTDVSSYKDRVCFIWRTVQYGAGLNGSVEEIEKGLLIGSDRAELISSLIKTK